MGFQQWENYHSGVRLPRKPSIANVPDFPVAFLRLFWANVAVVDKLQIHELCFFLLLFFYQKVKKNNYDAADFTPLWKLPKAPQSVYILNF